MRYYLTLSFIFISFIAFTQRSNIAHISTAELWEMMPEKKAADSILIKMNKEYSDHFNKVNLEIQELINQYQADQSSAPAVKADMAMDIQNKQVRLENFKKDAEAELLKRREELLAPIRKKMEDAINKVAKKNKYLYVLDSSYGNIIYVQNPADNILDLVKKELGL